MSDSVDTDLKLLAGEPLSAEGVGVLYPPTLREISRAGFTQYNQHVNVLTFDARNAVNPEDDSDEANAIRKLIDEDGILAFDIIFRSVDQTIADLCLDAVAFFFRVERPYYSAEDHKVYFVKDGVTSSKYTIDRESFEEMKRIVSLIACRVDSAAEEDENPADERAAMILAKLKQSAEVIRKMKEESGESDSLSIFDIISAVSTRSNSLNKITVWDLTLYQLFDEFKRLQSVDQYETGILAMMQIGNKAEFKHWATGYEDSE